MGLVLRIVASIVDANAGAEAFTRTSDPVQSGPNSIGHGAAANLENVGN